MDFVKLDRRFIPRVYFKGTDATLYRQREATVERRRVSRSGRSLRLLGSALPFAALALAFAASGCTPTDSVDVTLTRSVPDPLTLSGHNLLRDSIVTEEWTCRAEIPDPLAAGAAGMRMVVEATLFGRDVVDATLRESCRDTSGAPRDTVARRRCMEAAYGEYRAEHRSDTQFRIRLKLRSTFSQNSLDPKFWNIYIKNDDDIAVEPERVVMEDPVVVRHDSLARPGRPPIKAGLYTRTVDLYFAKRTPFGLEPLKDTEWLRLFISRNRQDQVVFTWLFGNAHERRRRALEY